MKINYAYVLCKLSYYYYITNSKYFQLFLLQLTPAGKHLTNCNTYNQFLGQTLFYITISKIFSQSRAAEKVEKTFVMEQQHKIICINTYYNCIFFSQQTLCMYYSVDD